MDRDSCRSTAAQAQAGDEDACRELIAGHLPLVYNIVGRALNGHPDTDDVVQETMLRAVDGLSGLREPAAFRSWLVAIAMNQVRHRYRAQQAAPAGGALDEARELPDPDADFVDLTIVRLKLSGQRREVAEATRWLDGEDREALALWWQEAAGELSRPELAAALELSPQHAAVRVQRVKERLDAARLVVRALGRTGARGCPELAAVTATWDGVPGALWRKRIARHARDCGVCQGRARDLVPAEGLLAGLALLPLPRHPGSYLPTAGTGGGNGTGTGTGDGRRSAGHRAGGTSRRRPATGHRRRTRPRGRRRLAVAALGALITLTAAGLVWDGLRPPPESAARADSAIARTAVDQSGEPAALLLPGAGLPMLVDAVAATAPAQPSGSPVASSPPPSTAPTPSPTPASPTPASPSAAVTSAKPTTAKPSVPSTATATVRTGGGDPSAYAQQVLDLVNSQRKTNGCGPVTANGKLQSAAQKQSDDMAARNFFDHTNPDGAGPQQRIDAAGYQWSTWGENIARGQRDPAAVMDSWMNSPGHRANILNCAFKELGVGIHLGPGGPWWTQDFGAP